MFFLWEYYRRMGTGGLRHGPEAVIVLEEGLAGSESISVFLFCFPFVFVSSFFTLIFLLYHSPSFPPTPPRYCFFYYRIITSLILRFFC
ncbi:hypothetical protein DFH27DRAFT_580402 [Peziza echinospora]|nr:hypothetical protein DFH27DRAFT_580402 [Peziza echinospora]